MPATIAPKADTPTLTDEERFLFDLKGYLLFPAVLSDSEIEPIKEQCEKIKHDKESLSPESQQLPGGPASVLIDHPAVMRVLHTIIDDDTEKLRLENAFLSYRTIDDGHKGWTPHAGGRTVNPNYSYQYHNGRIHAGMTRVVWELNPVKEWQGGTAFIPGTHKSNYRPFPAHYDDQDSGVWETYGCPPGSLLIFSEGVRHTACPWKMETPRMTLFYCYNHINVRHHKPGLSDTTLDSLSPEHRRFFNDVYHPQFDRWEKKA
jgi:hypothetical protein